jgi:hypothetical protein
LISEVIGVDSSYCIPDFVWDRALQSRLHPLVTAVEAFEVMKLGFGTDVPLLTPHQESKNIARFSLHIQSIKDTRDIF